MATLTDLVHIYLGNRAEFYAAVRGRIPQANLQAAWDALAAPTDPEAIFAQVVQYLPVEATADPMLTALGLRDVVKKPKFGEALGRTTISMTEALSRAEAVEETGLLLFERLARLQTLPSPPLEQAVLRHEAALAEILRVSDALRYHKFEF